MTEWGRVDKSGELGETRRKLSKESTLKAVEGIRSLTTNDSGQAVQGDGLRPISCWNCRFESHRGMDVSPLR